VKPIVLTVLATSYFKWFISSANNMNVIVCFSKRTMPILVDLFRTARKIPDSIDKPLLNYTIFLWGALFGCCLQLFLSQSCLCRFLCRPKPLQRANICRTVRGFACYFLAQLLAEFQLLTTECKIYGVLVSVETHLVCGA